MILCQTEKGKQLVENSKLNLYDVDLEKAVQANVQLYHPAEKLKVREKFFTGIKPGKAFERIMLICYPKQFVKNIIKTAMIKINLISREGIKK